MKKIILLTCMLLLGGCSTKFAYNNASWLIYWYMDDYIELNDAQEDQFDRYFAEWIEWHKAEELPKYAAQLNQIIEDIEQQNINLERIAFHRDNARAHWVRAREYIAEDLVALGRTLSEEQVVYLLAALEEENQEDEEEMAENKELSKDKRDRNWVKRNQKNIRRWMGRLSDEQKLFISGFRERFESTGVLWLDYKRRYQQALRETFAMSARDENFDAALLELIVNPEQYRGEVFDEATDRNLLAASEYMMGLYDMANKKQLKRLIDEIDSIKEDAISLQK
ncbi:DUF6279 family lipoprotein [Glaciecola petra]|uniref:DUF6279 family lipoprotein n=1 Tax=Glaciecola petra TaxID=3075602 RepID=A0ABU2ZS56_9ALTE|nr:DUF6279 family lipoprotein [Aestuariibacter sp. P117]MDT0594424.1 DUF6279 family lipoprotein [Aestuariibacter sp. P117]